VINAKNPCVPWENHRRDDAQVEFSKINLAIRDKRRRLFL
jgi:hypothetical protein